MDQYASDDHASDHLTKMRSVLSIRCLPKILSSSSTFTGSHITTLSRSLMWTNVRRDLNWDLLHRRLHGKNVCLTTGNFFPNLVQHDTSPHRHSQLFDLTMMKLSDYIFDDFFEVSLKSISLKWWLYRQMFKLTFKFRLTLSIAYDIINQSSYQWPWVIPICIFQRRDIIRRQITRKSCKIDHRAILTNYNGRPIESHWSIELRNFQWPWTTPNPDFKVMPLFNAEKWYDILI